MKALIYLMGKSASGKDTIYKKLLEDSIFNGVTIYTTRPKREHELDGQDYFFVDEKFLDAQSDKIIEKRVYNTAFGEWTYATLDDGQFDKNEVLVVIGTLESYIQCKKYFENELVLPIYIEVNNDIRLKRAIEREGEAITTQKLIEIQRRFQADEQDFSEENLIRAGIEYRYKNETIDDCVDKIRNNLRRIIERI